MWGFSCLSVEIGQGLVSRARCWWEDSRMSWAFALASGDPNLVGCVLAALAAEAPLKPTLPPEAYGIAYYQSDEALLERRPTGGQAFDLERLGRHMESELLLAQAQSAGDLLPSLPKDENTQPLRFRRWLFAQVGHLSGFPSLYPALKRNLPEFLERQIKGDTDVEVVFMHVPQAASEPRPGRWRDARFDGGLDG